MKRKAKCPLESCDWKGPLQGLRLHAKVRHPDIPYETIKEMAEEKDYIDESGGEEEGEEKGEKEIESTEKQNREQHRGQNRTQLEDPIYKPIDPRDIMLEVVRSPLANFNDRQVAELLDIAEDYDGLLSPEMFERIIVNFKGISPKLAATLKERLSVKLNKAQDRLSVAHADKLGLLGEPSRYSHERTERIGGNIGDIREQVRVGIAEGIKEGRKGLNIDKDVLSEPLSKALGNMADTTGLLNKFLNRVVLTAFEEEARQNPLFRKRITESIGVFMLKGKKKGEEEEEEEEDTGEMMEERRVEELRGKREMKGNREENLFDGLDKYFEEEEI